MASAPDRILVLRGGAVFDSESRTFRSGVDIVVRGQSIDALVAEGTPIEGSEALDCTGAYILPGLIDCHVHITASGDANGLDTARTDSLPVQAWKAAEHARRTLTAGFTTVRDLGAREHLNIHLAQAVDSGLLPGPRILAAGLGVTMTGGHGHGFIAREADGPDEVRKAVREQLRAGAKAIKLFASGGVLTPGVDPRSPSFTQEELAAGVEEAHKAFRVVGAHAQATDGIKNAIRAGVDSIEHGVWLDDEALELMARHGTYLVPTLIAPYLISKGGLAAGIPAFAVAKSDRVLQDHMASFERAVRAGVKIAMGTDQGTPLSRPGENAQEIVRIAEHGLSPAAAILAATRWASELLRIDAETGDLRPGLAADILVVDADPLADLAVLTRDESIHAILKGGNVVRRREQER